MTFRLFIQDINVENLWEVPFTSFTFAEELNKDRSLAITIDRATLDGYLEEVNQTKGNLFENEYREAKLYDEDENLLFYGFVDETSTSGGLVEAGTYTVTCKGFFTLLAKRYTNDLRTYTAQDSSDIAWDLINYTQGLTYGDLGISRGVDPTTVNRNRTIRYGEIKKEIEGLSNTKLKNGFDFEIDNLKNFNVFFPQKGSYKPEIILERGFNIDSYSVLKPGLMGLANQVLVFGEGIGEDSPVETRDAENVYKEKFTLLQDTLSEKDVSTIATLQDKGDSYLDDNKFQRKTIVIRCDYDIIPYNSFDLGDYIKIKIQQEDIDEFYRVIRRGVTEKSDVNITLYPI
jgi:hypothetical protein